MNSAIAAANPGSFSGCGGAAEGISNFPTPFAAARRLRPQPGRVAPVVRRRRERPGHREAGHVDGEQPEHLERNPEPLLTGPRRSLGHNAGTLALMHEANMCQLGSIGHVLASLHGSAIDSPANGVLLARFGFQLGG
jgi:hypothetical protein